MRFSLIVCTLGRRDEIAGLFESLTRQSRYDFEVILIDQNRDNRLVEIRERYAKDFPIKHLRMQGTGASRARNLGIDHATGELLGFPDDDCKYLDRFLNNVNDIFTRNPTIGCISGFPTTEMGQIGSDYHQGHQDLGAFAVLNRAQEFTIFVRASSLGDLRYNELMGVGAQTRWGADEGPELMIRLASSGCRLVSFPNLLVYHPNKRGKITRQSLARTASYSRGRGCLLRLHRFPLRIVFGSLFRSFAGCLVYLLRLQFMQSVYYFIVVQETLRGLLMSRAELSIVRDNTHIGAKATEQV